MGSMYIATSVLTSLVFVLFCAALSVGCGPSGYNGYYWGGRRLQYINDVSEYTTSPYTTELPRIWRARYDYSEYGPRYKSSYPEFTTLSTDDFRTYNYYEISTGCVLPGYSDYVFQYTCALLLPYKIPSLILLFSLVIITARLAWSVRQTEKHQPDIAVLPQNKMVTLYTESTVVGMASVVGSGDEDEDDKVYPETTIRAGQTV